MPVPKDKLLKNLDLALKKYY